MIKAKAGQRVPENYGTNRKEILQVTDGWRSSKPLSEWYGVTTNEEGRVIGLNLDRNDLAGKRRYDAIPELAQQPHSKLLVPQKC